MPSLFTKLWTLIGHQDRARHQGQPRGFRPLVEAFEERLVLSQLPAPTLGLISGQVFQDSNKNSVFDSGDKGITGISVILTGKTAQNATVKSTILTDANGNFTFFQIQPGTYTLTRALGNQVTATTSAGNTGGSRGAATISNILVGPGQVSTHNDFAIRSISSTAISLRQFLTTNPFKGLAGLFKPAGSGTLIVDKSVQPNALANFGTPASSTLAGAVLKDADSTGITGVQVVLTGIDDSGKSIFDTQTTDSAGAYTFTVARPGDYTVQMLNQPTGFRAGQAVPGSLGGLAPLNTQIFGIHVTAGSTATGYNFREIASAAVTADAARPVIGAELVDDTFGPGGTNSDKISADVSIQGTVVSSRAISKFLAGIDTNPVNVSILNAMSTGGKFYLNLAQLQAINKFTLSQGLHTLHLVATDAKGNKSAQVDFQFTIDSNTPTTPTLVLDAASDTGASAIDGRTDKADVTLSGTTSTGSVVEVFQNGAATPLAGTSTVDATTGIYTVTGVTLAAGVNDFIVRSRDSAGNLTQFNAVFILNQDPTVKTAVADVTVNQNASPTTVDLAANFTDADITNSIVRLNTNFGNIDLEMLDTATPQTVANFLNYVSSGRFDSIIFNRLVKDFVLQGGGFKFTAGVGTAAPTFPAVAKDPAVNNEFDASRSNLAGTLAMAKSEGNPDSATNEFFFNLSNNSANLDNQNGGFTVFARVLSGLDQRVVNTMVTVPVVDQSKAPPASAANPNGNFTNLPLQNFKGTSFPTGATKDNFLFVNNATVLRQTEALTYSLVSNSNPDLATVTFANNRMTLTYANGKSGEADITIRATDKFGATTEDTFHVSVADPNVNTPPVANTTTLTTAENVAVTVDLQSLASDTETADANLVFSVSNGTNGTATLGADGHTATFTPNQNYNGPATFIYSVTDTGNGTGAALTTGPVTIDVTVTAAVNTPPVATTTTLTTTQNIPVTVDLQTLASDTETVDANLVFSVSPGTNGTVTLGADGHTASFTPSQGFVGDATFTYSVTDTGNGSAAALTTGSVTVAVTVTA